LNKARQLIIKPKNFKKIIMNLEAIAAHFWLSFSTNVASFLLDPEHIF
jgi:hypothetical protein